MIDKKNLWFLTLFALVLVLSIYYVTMPNDLLAASSVNSKDLNSNVNSLDTKVEEASVISALKVEDDTKTKDELDKLQKKLTDSNVTVEEKNNTYEQIKTINNNSGLENSIEEDINKNYNCDSFVKIENSSVKVVVDKCDNSKALANNIMRTVQEKFSDKMYISVQFKS